jgi:hypothetical protein
MVVALRLVLFEVSARLKSFFILWIGWEADEEAVELHPFCESGVLIENSSRMQLAMLLNFSPSLLLSSSYMKQCMRFPHLKSI